MDRKKDIDDRALGGAAAVRPPRAPGERPGTPSSRENAPPSPSPSGSASGPTLPTPTVPKGGGAIRGIGEKFEMAAVTGTASLSVPLALSPGRSGFQPTLALSYSSGAGNGPFGVGWTLETPRISRRTDRKLPEYHDTAESDVFLLSGAEDLVPELQATGAAWSRTVVTRDGLRIERYRPRTEGLFARIERRTHLPSGNVYWVSIDRNNVTSLFGSTPAARIADPADARRVFAWLLEATYDDRGNVILYDYKAEDLRSVPRTISEESRHAGAGVGARKYLKRIRYGNVQPVRGQDLLRADLEAVEGWCFSAVFDYGEHDEAAPTPAEVRAWPCRTDPFSTYKARFEERTYRLCRRVLMFHSFAELGAEPVVTKSTEFHYDEGPSLTYLRGVTHKGWLQTEEGYTTKAMPPVEFDYQLPVLSSTVRELDPKTRKNLPPQIDGKAHRWVDLDGEGIAGLLSEEGGAWRYRKNLGEGKLAAPRTLPRRPTGAGLSGSRQDLLSLEPDGRLEVVDCASPVAGYHERTDDDGWTALKKFRWQPVVDWNDPNLQFIDLNGDGFADILITRGDSLLWYPSRGKEGFDAPRSVALGADERKAPTVVFADGAQTIHLADMSGDGLVDLVRIRNGEVCYWPNLGFGKFGAKVSMENAPWFDRPNQFDGGRVRLFDVDGSGTTDIVYCGPRGVHLYANQAGNRLAAGQLLTDAFPAHASASIGVTDLLGTGTGCLVWVTTLASEGAPRVRYIDLLSSQKPHLLVAHRNGMGLERLLTYAPSTKFYLEDQAAGSPWATKLRFPVQVCMRIEVRDHLAGTRLVSTYRYRHGYYDGYEREFRGFAYVEQRDAETVGSSVGAGTFPSNLFPEVEGEFVLPPTVIRTWFHTGAWQEKSTLTAVLRREYYDADPDAVFLPDTAYSGTTLTGVVEEREAARALKGLVLRQETYAEDGTEREAHPYVVSERCYEVRRLQPRGEGAPHAVFFAHPREELAYQYERTPSDPRVLHTLTLEVDDFGMPRRTAAIAYPRRSPAAIAAAEQGTILVTVASAEVAHKTSETHWYRVGVPLGSETHELTGLVPPSHGVLRWDVVKAAVDAAAEIAFDQAPSTGLQRRVLTKQRVRYYADDLTGPLPLGIVESLALPYRSEQLAFSAGLLSAVYGSDATATMLQDEGGYLGEAGDYWAQGARLVFDDAAFYVPVGLVGPWGNESSVTYDDYALLPTEAHGCTSTPALDNVVTVENDYRVLQPKLVTDPNDNRTAVEFDALGMVSKLGVMGKVGAGEGDTLVSPTAMFEYDLWAFKNSGQPTVAHAQAREVHGGTPTWQHTYQYTDGMGRELLTKTQAPGDQWIGTGRTVFDNKGNPIRQYEPYFSATNGYESEAAIVATGVTPVLRYDPVGRLIRTDFPDGTFSRVEFDAWRETSFDQNDTVAESLWYARRQALDSGHPDHRASDLAYVHRDTPTVTHTDVLGRKVVVVQDAGGGTLYTTRSQLDIQGNVGSVTDARSIVTMAQTCDMLNRVVRTVSAEQGTSRLLPDIAGAPLRTWNSRLFRMRTVFDALRRPTHVFSKHDTDDETLVLRTLYGESLGSSASRAANLRGQPYRRYDSAGVETDVARDFKGNLLEQTRSLAIDYETTPDWIDLAALTDPEDVADAAATLLETEVFTTSTTYDALNRVVTSTTPDASVTWPTYNEANQLIAAEANLRGAGSATEFVAAVVYNARGQRVSIEYANGTSTAYTYDAETFRLTRLLTERASDDAVLQDLRYYYDPVGNIVELKDYAQDTIYFSNTVVSPDSRYEYDPLYRLVWASGREHPAHSASQPNEVDSPLCSLPHPNDVVQLQRYVEQYEYDGVGNIASMTHRETSGGTINWKRLYQYATTSNKLVSTSESGDTPAALYTDTPDYTDTYTHDARGNMTAMPHLAAMDWDFGDRLVHCDLGGGGDSHFVYDADGLRVRKVWVKSASLVEECIYLGAYEVWRKKVSGTLDEERQTLHVMDGERRVVMAETLTVEDEDPVVSPDSHLRYQLCDHLESSRIECDGSGELLTHELYHPYGTTALRAASGVAGFAAKRYRHAGKERDEETGLHYYGARSNCVWLGRWVSVDPAIRLGPSPFEFCNSSPIGSRDPDGRDPVQAGKIEDETPGGTKLTSEERADAIAKDAERNIRRKEIQYDESIGIGPKTKGYGSETSIQAKLDKAAAEDKKGNLTTALLWKRRAAREAIWAQDPSIDPATVSIGRAGATGHALAETVGVPGLKQPEIVVSEAVFAGDSVIQAVHGSKFKDGEFIDVVVSPQETVQTTYERLREAAFHEGVHQPQWVKNPRLGAVVMEYRQGEVVLRRPGIYMGEVEAYGKQLAEKDALHLHPTRVSEIVKHIRENWNLLNDKERASVLQYIPSKYRAEATGKP